ncbi:AAA family ATPase [Paenibacillus bovis]|uniref:ATPase n=1 Tax=Paenibacillus bovis TaxID=1616788 RepID=A0A172ZHM7_9BACL|nr:ATP-binding protein [Paenibacillus bovis]ANF97126.1 ATPase [Paenibacillus bovis]
MSKNRRNYGKMPLTKGIEMASVYSVKECGHRARHIVLSPENKMITGEFLRIIDMKDQFAVHDVPVPNKMMMFGPPGTGKTLTAFHLAHQLELPLVTVRLDALIHAHLGETGSNVRRIFEYARIEPCVLFMDEFDAVARTRDNNDEVKEMARVVNTLLQCLDEFPEHCIFIAATNLETELDNAIWRRFDTKMVYSNPAAELRLEYIRRLCGDFPSEPGLQEWASEKMEGCSYADLEQIILKAKRKAIIDNIPLSRLLIDLSIQEYRPYHLIAAQG